jgi:branched-chain amino acid transport system permease protein
MIWQFLTNGLITGTVYGIVALGFALVYNTTRIFHIAYAAIYMVAPYMMLFAMQSLGLPIWAAALFALLVTMAVGWLTDFAVYSPLNRQGGSSTVIMVSSIGVMIIVINLVAMLFGNETKMLNTSISDSITILGLLITHSQMMQFLVSVCIIILFFLLLKFSSFGIKTRAYRDDEKLAAVLRMNVPALKHKLFLMSSLLAGVGSCLIAWDVGFNPYVGMPILLNAVVALIIGGVGRFEAPLIGGLIIGVLQAMVVYATSARWQDAVTFTLLILFLLFRPQGILGEKIRRV